MNLKKIITSLKIYVFVKDFVQIKINIFRISKKKDVDIMSENRLVYKNG